MAVLKSLTCIRPKPELAGQIASGPHSAMSSEEIRQKIKQNPISYTRIVHPKFLYAERPKNIDEVYIRAAENLEEWIRDGIMIDDEEPAFYLYRMEYQEHRQAGIVCRIPVDEILNHTVKAHERVRENKLADLAHHVELCRAQIGGPILMTYRHREEITAWEEKIEGGEPLYHFYSENHVWTTIWKISDEKEIRCVEELTAKIPSLYIADGHHRIMSAVKICQDMRRKHPDYTGQEAWNYVTCVCFPDDQLKILPYSRIVTVTEDGGIEELLDQLTENFEVIPEEEIHAPEERGCFTMIYGKQAWTLRLKEDRRPKEVPESLDVSVLQSLVLQPLLGINNDKKDSRLEFMGGEEQIHKVTVRCQHGGHLGFLLYPTQMEEILQVADRSAVMPPKSTWFSPKMCNGLFIYRIFPKE